MVPEAIFGARVKPAAATHATVQDLKRLAAHDLDD
jgi:hypothetical protein